MRILDIITEASALDLGKVTKHPERAQKFLDLISSGHTFNSNIGPVKVDPASIAELTPILNKKNVGSGVRPMVIILEPEDRKGERVLMSTLHYDDAAFGGKGKSYSTAVSLKPHPVFGHQNPEQGQTVTPQLAIKLGGFMASELNDKIQANQVLDQQGQAGAAVKQISEQISQGQVPLIPNLPANQLGPILNDAFEYLGVLQLIKGTATFPNSEAFYNHVGSNLEELVLYFPGAVNHPLADSYALKNMETENTIYISSKGGKTGKGAPSSIGTLKIPEEMRSLIGRDPAITFIDMLQQYGKGKIPAWQQPFDAANWIEEQTPGALGPLSKFLPFSEQFTLYLSTILEHQNEGVPTEVSQIPKEYQKLYSLVDKSVAGDTPLFYKVRYYVLTQIHNAVNSGRAVPNFSPRMLELLGENFVSLATKAIGKPGTGNYITTVKWPSKMGGKITFNHKAEASKWGTSMTWLLN